MTKGSGARAVLSWIWQNVWIITVVVGGLIATIGTFGGKIEDNRNKAAAKLDDRAARKVDQDERRDQFDTVQKQLGTLLQAANLKLEVWQSVQTEMVPPGFAAYVNLLFKADRGRVVGKIRMKGSDVVTSFATDVNDQIPVAVANVWDASTKQYRVPTVIEFVLTEKTFADAQLSIFIQGWIDSLGQPPGGPPMVFGEPDHTAGLPKLHGQ